MIGPSGEYIESDNEVVFPFGGVFDFNVTAPEPSADVFINNMVDEISCGMRLVTAAKLGGVLVE